MNLPSHGRRMMLQPWRLSLGVAVVCLLIGLAWRLVDPPGTGFIGLCYLALFYSAISGMEHLRLRGRRPVPLPCRREEPVTTRSNAERILAI